jgi:DNA-directed RNA polymerase beta' subunit
LGAVEEQNPEAVVALDRVMAESLVVLWRSPSVAPTSTVALMPLRVPHKAIAISPLLCRWLDADFDGDLVSLTLPLTAEAQQEAREKLTVAAHLRRDPALVKTLLPPAEAVWGLSLLRMSEEGKAALAEAAGHISTHGELVAQWELQRHAARVLAERGPEAAIAMLERIAALGFAAAASSGASFDPFVSAQTVSTEDEGALFEALEASRDYRSAALGPQLIMTHAAIRGKTDNLIQLLRRRHRMPRGLLDGLEFDDFMQLSLQMRRHLAAFLFRWENLGQELAGEQLSRATTVLARARRSELPGVVFASAASRGEIDPLTDRDARLLAGLLPDRS